MNKHVLVEQLKGEIKKELEAVKLLKHCLDASQKHQVVTQQMALEPVKIIVQSHQILSKISAKYVESGTAEARRLDSFINNSFKQTILKLGNSMKAVVAVKGATKAEDSVDLEKCINEFVSQVRRIMSLLKEDESNNQAPEKLNPPPPPIVRKSRVSIRSSNRKNSSEKPLRDKVRSSRIFTSTNTTDLPNQNPLEFIKRIEKEVISEEPGEEISISLPPSAALDRISEAVSPPPKQSITASNDSIFGCYTDPGDRYGDMNQDSFMACRSGDGYFIGIFDGHGPNGEVASQVAADSFKEFFSKINFFSYDKKKQHDLIKEAFHTTHNRIISEYSKDYLKTIEWNGSPFKLREEDGFMVYHNRKQGTLLQDFGTTAVFAAVKITGGSATELIIANSGDSVSIIGRHQKEEFSSVANICEIHNGHNQHEVTRISKFGSTVVEDDYISAPEESGISWAQLAVTRALGHRYLVKYGIIPDPHIASYSLRDIDKYLVLCSDGVTDVLSGDEIVEVVSWYDNHSEGNMQNVAKRLVKYALENWEEEADNTTAIVLKLK